MPRRRRAIKHEDDKTLDPKLDAMVRCRGRRSDVRLVTASAIKLIDLGLGFLSGALDEREGGSGGYEGIDSAVDSREAASITSCDSGELK